MKGVSIAIETIIYIILAVLVLTVLLFFFTSQAGTAQNQFQFETQRDNYCQQYINIVPLCDSTSGVSDRVLKNITEACAGLKKRGCVAGSVDLQCIRNCCIYCPKT